jgi:membrane-associated protease RseP (regulator of RpoE activity)
VKQNVSGSVVVLVVFVVLVLAYVFFYRAELAPPGVDLLHSHEEEAPVLPQTPEVSAEEFRKLAIGLMPLGVTAVFPPLSEDRFQGARIASVAPGSAAAAAGLRPGDLVKRFGERETAHPFALVAALTAVEPDESYDIIVVRSKEEQTLVVTGITPLPLEEQVR